MEKEGEICAAVAPLQSEVLAIKVDVHMTQLY